VHLPLKFVKVKTDFPDIATGRGSYGTGLEWHVVSMLSADWLLDVDMHTHDNPRLVTLTSVEMYAF